MNPQAYHYYLGYQPQNHRFAINPNRTPTSNNSPQALSLRHVIRMVISPAEPFRSPRALARGLVRGPLGLPGRAVTAAKGADKHPR